MDCTSKGPNTVELEHNSTREPLKGMDGESRPCVVGRLHAHTVIHTLSVTLRHTHIYIHTHSHTRTYSYTPTHTHTSQQGQGAFSQNDRARPPWTKACANHHHSSQRHPQDQPTAGRAAADQRCPRNAVRSDPCGRSALTSVCFFPSLSFFSC